MRVIDGDSFSDRLCDFFEHDGHAHFNLFVVAWSRRIAWDLMHRFHTLASSHLAVFNDPDYYDIGDADPEPNGPVHKALLKKRHILVHHLVCNRRCATIVASCLSFSCPFILVLKLRRGFSVLHLDTDTSVVGAMSWFPDPLQCDVSFAVDDADVLDASLDGPQVLPPGQSPLQESVLFGRLMDSCSCRAF